MKRTGKVCKGLKSNNDFMHIRASLGVQRWLGAFSALGKSSADRGTRPNIIF